MRVSSTGFVRKIETLGTLDGPGIRTVVFLSGCPLRCIYCHNPDMWKAKKKDEVEVEKIMKRLTRMKSFYGKEGGVTFCGGEPLAQPGFLLALAKSCKEEGIHTCLDTSGCGIEETYDEILEYIDLILLDIKGINDEMQKELCGREFDQGPFIKKAQEKKIPLWIRMVIIPGYNDKLLDMDELIKIVKRLDYVEKIELLPYHTLGAKKYESMNIMYPLQNTRAMDVTEINTLQEYVNQKWKEVE